MSKPGPKSRNRIVIALQQDWTAPSNLGAVARAEFLRIADLLGQRGDRDATDVQIVVSRAQKVEIRDAAYAQILADGINIESDRGNISAHPAVRIHQAAVEEIRRHDETLGLTPASALATGKTDQSGYSQWAKYLGGKSS